MFFATQRLGLRGEKIEWRFVAPTNFKSKYSAEIDDIYFSSFYYPNKESAKKSFLQYRDKLLELGFGYMSDLIKRRAFPSHTIGVALQPLPQWF